MTASHKSPLSSAIDRRNALRLLSLPVASCVVAVPAFAQAPAAKMPRIVSVSGATTEIVYALGAESQLVGTDTTSLYPPAALKTTKVGYMRALSAEGLLALKPDAVIGTTESGPTVVIDQIRSAGVKVELVEADHTWAEVQRKVAAVGRATARVAQAAALQAKLDAEWATVLATVAKQTGRKPRAVFILAHSATPQVAGDKNGASAVLRFAGIDNVLASSFAGYRPMTSEAMVTAAPDLIITTTQGIEAGGGLDKFWARPGLELTPAYKKRSLVALDANYLIGFGPRLPQAVAELNQAALKAIG